MATDDAGEDVYGMFAVDGIGYRQGPDWKIQTAINPILLVDLTEDPKAWDPLHGTGTNRRFEMPHAQGIKDYLEAHSDDYTIGAVTLYGNVKEWIWKPTNPNSPISPGKLYFTPSVSKLEIGDGQHRIAALRMYVKEHFASKDEAFDVLKQFGQPVTITLNDDPIRRARDFVVLQKNLRVLNQSISQSMDSETGFNNLLMEIIKEEAIPVFAGGEAIEFNADTIGKLSWKFATFKAVRYASGTAIIGMSERSTRGWVNKVELSVAADRVAVRDAIVDFWTCFSQIPAVDKAAATITKDKKAKAGGMALLREETFLTAANLHYALAGAIYTVGQDGTAISDAFDAMSDVRFTRTDPTVLLGSLIDLPTARDMDAARKAKVPPKYRIRSGRDAWTGGAAALVEHVQAKFGA